MNIELFYCKDPLKFWVGGSRIKHVLFKRNLFWGFKWSLEDNLSRCLLLLKLHCVWESVMHCIGDRVHELNRKLLNQTIRLVWFHHLVYQERCCIGNIIRIQFVGFICSVIQTTFEGSINTWLKTDPKKDFNYLLESVAWSDQTWNAIFPAQVNPDLK